MLIADMRPYLNIAADDTTHDDVIESLYNLAKAIFTQNTRCEFTSETVEDELVDFQSNRLYPRTGPVTSITSIEYAGTVTGDLTAYTDYKLVGHAVYLDAELTAAYLKVTYLAGYAEIPAIVDQILIQLISFLWHYDDTKVVLSGNTEVMLTPNDIVVPKHIRESMAVYRIGL